MTKKTSGNRKARQASQGQRQRAGRCSALAAAAAGERHRGVPRVQPVAPRCLQELRLLAGRQPGWQGGQAAHGCRFHDPLLLASSGVRRDLTRLLLCPLLGSSSAGHARLPQPAGRSRRCFVQPTRGQENCTLSKTEQVSIGSESMLECNQMGPLTLDHGFFFSPDLVTKFSVICCALPCSLHHLSLSFWAGQNLPPGECRHFFKTSR